MKLLRLKLEEKYRSLEPFEQKFPYHKLINTPDKTEVDPICLVGLNGCGKSNLLELIADIFYLLDSKYLSYGTSSYIPYADNKEKKEIYFEIEYFLHSKKQKIRISRLKEHKGKISFYIVNEDELTEITSNQRDYLPKVISYTSGFNELLSMPFIELQDIYSNEVARKAFEKDESSENAEEPKLIFLDNVLNEIIVLTNFLMLKSDILKVFQEKLNIESIDSFSIVIQYKKLYGNKKLKTTTEIDEFIEKLKSCSTCYEYDKTEDTHKFDCFIDNESKKAFEKLFITSENLFKSLYKLNLLNCLCIQKKYRQELSRHRKKGNLINFPEVSELDKIFRISEINLNLNQPKVRSEYIRISDGQHQFIQIFGAIFLFAFSNSHEDKDILYLFDEPDTHFNPEWRRKFFSVLNDKVGTLHHEVIITTHSPFILSDCHGYKVFQFKKENGSVTFQRSQYETYGSSVSFILENIFNFHHPQISDNSLEDIKELKDINDLDKLKEQIRLYGDSTEKLLILNHIHNLEGI